MTKTMREKVPEEKFHSVRTLAARFDLSERHLRRLVAEGRLLAVRIGGTAIRIPESEVARFMREAE